MLTVLKVLTLVSVSLTAQTPAPVARDGIITLVGVEKRTHDIVIRN